MELIWPAICFLLGVLVTYTWLHPGWLRQALRRRLQSRWLRKRLESYEAEDRAESEPRHDWHLSKYGIPHCRICDPRPRCRLCNPQPTSAQTSSEATETEEATQHGS